MMALAAVAAYLKSPFLLTPLRYLTCTLSNACGGLHLIVVPPGRYKDGNERYLSLQIYGCIAEHLLHIAK